MQSNWLVKVAEVISQNNKKFLMDLSLYRYIVKIKIQGIFFFSQGRLH